MGVGNLGIPMAYNAASITATKLAFPKIFIFLAFNSCLSSKLSDPQTSRVQVLIDVAF